MLSKYVDKKKKWLLGFAQKKKNDTFAPLLKKGI